MTNQSDVLGENLLQAMACVGYIQKDKRNKHSNYNYLSEEATKKAVQAALLKSGVMPSSIRFETLTDEWLPIGKGKQNIVKVLVTITFGTSESSGQRTYQGLGAGVDYTDKATMKAQTSALREAWKNVFCIPSGNDPEEDTVTPEHIPTQEAPEAPKGRVGARASKPASDKELSQPVTESGLRTQDQYQEILELLDGGAMDRAAAGRFVKEQYGCTPVTLTVTQADEFLAYLKGLRS